ncbi:MAG: helix-turn-helix transcriptional regulator [Endozoicomonadaceae bacterium]|nr:helix-turn-helix transcriptional regulator [Endozoicomonadaceae bacterium]
MANDIKQLYSKKDAISTRLREARASAGYRFAKDFSGAIDIPYITYSQHESGKRSVKPEQLLIYSENLKVSVQWLLTGHDVDVKSDQIDISLLFEIYDQVLRIVQSMSLSMSQRDILKMSCNIYNAFRSNKNSEAGLFKIIVNHLAELSLKKHLA